MTRSQKMREKLAEAFQPVELDIVDESEAHRGHAGFQDGGESHFRVRVVSGAFEGQNRIARHRAVHAALGKELVSEIHALSLDLQVP